MISLVATKEQVVLVCIQNMLEMHYNVRSMSPPDRRNPGVSEPRSKCLEFIGDIVSLSMFYFNGGI
jgi:hypothetical protein